MCVDCRSERRTVAQEKLVGFKEKEAAKMAMFVQMARGMRKEDALFQG
jgi:hypothetical protein